MKLIHLSHSKLQSIINYPSRAGKIGWYCWLYDNSNKSYSFYNMADKICDTLRYAGISTGSIRTTEAGLTLYYSAAVHLGLINTHIFTSLKDYKCDTK